jgi:hypothetical protein
MAPEDDPEASERVQRLLDSPSYRQADQDPAFLERPQMCGVRLQLDYWKTEELLLRHRIEHTVVVYGSTRIPEPSAARRKLDAARAALRARSGDAELAQAVRVA